MNWGVIVLGGIFIAMLVYDVDVLVKKNQVLKADNDRLKKEKNELLRKMESGFFGEGI
jgi:cell division protein FtsB